MFARTTIDPSGEVPRSEGSSAHAVATPHDVVIIGAGPVGALAAYAFARSGARVALIEANPNATARLAGEWIHPPGVGVLDRLRAGRLEEGGARVGYGFAVLPDDGSSPIELPYPGGVVALACEHRAIVASLRERALGLPGVTYVAGRTLAITEHGVIVEDVRSGSRQEVRAHRIVGADGRSSLTARYLGAREGELQSYMAAVELHGVELPREGFGNVVLGGPGPALLYRLDDDRVRACLDVPIALGNAARTPQFLWDGYAPSFPPALRASLRRALERGDVMWAATRFRPRTHHGAGRVIAIGDAVGHCHPLTAIGLTQGFLDAEAAAAGEVPSYPGNRMRDSYTAELLVNALYQVMRRDDRDASAIRMAMYDAWRGNATLRERSMQLLMGDARHPLEFAAAYCRIAATALARELRDGLPRRRALQRAAAFRHWVPWGVAAMVPHVVRSRYRARTTSIAPLPGLRGTAGERDVVPVAPSPGLDRELLARTLDDYTTALRPAGAALPHDRTQALLALLDARREPPAVIEVAVRAVVRSQAEDGGFGDAIATELACRALRQARPVVPAAERSIDLSLARAAHWLRSQQDDDGGQPGPVDATAAAIEAWIHCGVPVTDPAMRRALRWLVRHQMADGAWPGAPGRPASAVATARALGALTHGPYRAARERGAAALVRIVDAGLLDRTDATPRLRDLAHAPIVMASVHALAAIARTDGELATAARRPRLAAPRATDEDRSYCEHAMGEVSRTFARPIAMLPPPLATAVGCGYLLCRIADTIEDHPGLALDERERMFGVFLATLEGGDARALARGFEAIGGDDAELSLGRNCERVVRVLASLDGAQRAACRRWISEMARGMNLYAHRPPGRDDIVALTTLADLERYCYFVAGTVGNLLTDVFTAELALANNPALRVDAERFGAGLQLVNILKDVTEDRARGWSYIPRSACAEHGLEVRELVDPAHRARAHKIVAPVFAMARANLDGALRYALAVPPAHAGVRMFCLLPLWMAARTLMHARGNDAMFEAGAEVKISRAEVEAIIAEVSQLVGDDDALARRYRTLWEVRP